MARTLAAVVACILLSLPGCSKASPGFSGSGSLKMKDPVHATYGWSKGRMIYVIYFVPPTSGFNPDGIAAAAKISKDPKEADTFEGALDGNLEKSRFPFKANGKTFEVSYEGKTYRTANGAVFLVNTGTPSKVQQLQATFGPTPKDHEMIPEFMENEVRRLAKETPKIGEFPKEPAPEKPATKKK